MDLFVIALIALPIIGLKVSKTGFGEDYLPLEQTNQLKGFFALVVILHHLAQRTKGGMLFPFFNHVGYLAVSVFLFISGYGLMLQYMKRKEDYIKHFLSRRLLKVVLPYIIAIVIYYVSYLIIGLEMSGAAGSMAYFALRARTQKIRIYLQQMQRPALYAPKI